MANKTGIERTDLESLPIEDLIDIARDLMRRHRDCRISIHINFTGADVFFSQGDTEGDFSMQAGDVKGQLVAAVRYFREES